MGAKKEVMKTSGNAFGERLEQILTAANVKNYTVAKALNYDVSYISKWINGKAVPSRKNLEKTVSAIAKAVSEQGSGESFRTLCRRMGAETQEQIYTKTREELKNAYFQTTGVSGDKKSMINNASLRISPESRYPLLLDYAEKLDTEKSLDIAVVADIFSLDHGSKLRMAGINNHRFTTNERRKDVKLSYVIDLSKLNENSIYDVILLIHMMTCYSLLDFHLYYSKMASDKLVIAVKNEFSGVSMLGNDRKFLCTAASGDKDKADELYESIRGSINPDSSLFFETDMESLLDSHEYLQTLLSQNTRWLVGHVTEHFLPPELFDIFLEQCFEPGSDTAEEARRAHILTLNAIERGQLRIMVYNRALVDFVLSGEMDFFNNKVILNPEQRKQTLIYIDEIMRKVEKNNVKLVIDGFSDDFKYITNPCIFLSDSMDYLRLENQIYENNLMLVKDDAMRKIFDVFFENIWNCEQNVIGTDETTQRLKYFIDTSEILRNV